ncbi:Hypothetical predicted protein, partial [Olea europaea subsp. europaea]
MLGHDIDHLDEGYRVFVVRDRGRRRRWIFKQKRGCDIHFLGWIFYCFMLICGWWLVGDCRGEEGKADGGCIRWFGSRKVVVWRSK